MEEQLRGFPLMFHNGLLRLACTNAGQFMFNNVDKYLQIMESLNCYAVPEFQQVEAKKIMKGHRQIPWVFFIPGLLFFRIVRFVATMTFWFLGGNPVTPLSVVHYLQARRRRLRNIKIQGLRILNRAEYTAEDEPPSRFYIFTKYLEMVFQKLQSLFCMAARHSFRDDAGISVFVQGPEKARRNRRKTDLDLNLHVNQFTTSELLDKYAAEDDKEDPDFFNDIESPYEDSLDSDLDDNSTNNISLTSALYGNYELNENNLSPKTAESKNQLEVNAKYPECEQHEQCQQLNQQNGDLEKDKNSVYELHKQSPETGEHRANHNHEGEHHHN